VLGDNVFVHYISTIDDIHTSSKLLTVYSSRVWAKYDSIVPYASIP
jgi:hypothetical protein